MKKGLNVQQNENQMSRNSNSFLRLSPKLYTATQNLNAGSQMRHNSRKQDQNSSKHRVKSKLLILFTLT